MTDQNRPRVVVTGMGAVTPLGLSVDEFWLNLVAGKCGIAPITMFDASNFPVKVAGEVKNFDPTRFMEEKRADRTGLCSQYALAAAKMAAQSAQLDMSKEKAERVGVVIGTNGMPELLAEQLEVIKTKGPMRVDPLLVSKFRASMVPAHIGLELGAKGINTSINSACNSGNDAIGMALSFLRLGYADVILAGGAGANVTLLALAATNRIGALSREADPAKACRPFDMNRSGFVYGSGAGVLVLESLEHALDRGAPILAEIAGVGWSFDAYSETAPDIGQRAAGMRMALADARLTPLDVDYINAHGTGTKQNDTVETQSIKMVFQPSGYVPPISSNKSMIGHLAGAAGAVECIASVKTIQEGVIPPTIHYETPDPECDLDYVPNVARRQKVDVCLANSFGLGGQNCTIILKRYI
jgi:3-oxoacyl-[acyl-carrier-protein] synthase II